MRDKRKYEELFPDELAGELERRPIVYCAFGPVEYHGAHAALGIDPLKGYDICLRAADISGGVVFPMVPFGPDGSMALSEMLNRDGLRKMRNMFPSVFTGVDLCAAFYYELFEALAEDVGFKVCAAFGGHGPSAVLIKHISDQNNGVIMGMRLIPCGSLSHIMDLVKEENSRLGIDRVRHGGMWESAMLAGRDPDLVNPENLLGDAMLNRDNRNCGNTYDEIKKVSPVFGARLLQSAAERIAAAALKALGETG